MDRGDLTPENLKHRAEQGLPLDLNKQLQMLLATPCASDHKGSGTNETVRNRLDYDIEKTPDGQMTGLKLQPAFVEWMMALPLNWASLEHETIEPLD